MGTLHLHFCLQKLNLKGKRLCITITKNEWKKRYCLEYWFTVSYFNCNLFWLNIYRKIINLRNEKIKIYFNYKYLFRSSTTKSWISGKGMHTIFTLSQAGDLGYIKNVFFQLVKSVECKKETKKSTSNEKLNKIFCKNRTNLRQKLDVICCTSNNFNIKSLNVIKYVKNNLPIFGKAFKGMLAYSQ